MAWWRIIGGGIFLLLALLTAFGLFGGRLSRAVPNYSTRSEDDKAAGTNDHGG